MNIFLVFDVLLYFILHQFVAFVFLVYLLFLHISNLSFHFFDFCLQSVHLFLIVVQIVFEFLALVRDAKFQILLLKNNGVLIYRFLLDVILGLFQLNQQFFIEPPLFFEIQLHLVKVPPLLRKQLLLLMLQPTLVLQLHLLQVLQHLSMRMRHLLLYIPIPLLLLLYLRVVKRAGILKV